MNLKGIIAWYEWILSFSFIKYIGILIMILGPMFLTYRFIFKNSETFELFLGSLTFLIIGSIFWYFGWDPYAKR